MSETITAPTTPVVPKKVLVIFKVALVEWLGDGEMEGSPLVPVRREELTSEHTNQALDILDALNVGIDNEISSDWVELKRTVDDRVSVLHPGSYIVVWSDGTASFLDNVKAVTYSGDTVSVEF